MNWQSQTNRGGEKRLVTDLGEHGNGKRLGETLINRNKTNGKRHYLTITANLEIRGKLTLHDKYP